MISRFAAVLDRRQVLTTLVRRDLRVRYAQSVLGYVWTILDPLLMASVYFVVFTFIFKARVAEAPYFLYLLLGLLAWQWFSTSVLDTTLSLVREAKLVRSTNVPRELWVVRVVVAKGVEFVLSMPVVVGFTVFYLIRGEAELDAQLVLVPVAMVMQFALLVGLGLLLAPVNVLVTDTERVVRILMRFLFYMTPVIYGLRHVPEPLRYILEANPMTGILELYRAGFFDAQVHWRPVIIGTVVTVVLLVVGSLVFARMERAVLKEI